MCENGLLLHKPKFHLARHITSQHVRRVESMHFGCQACRTACMARHARHDELDMFNVSSQSSSSCRAVLFNKLDTAKMHGLDTFDMLSPCILAVSSLSNSTAQHASLNVLDTSRRDEPSGIWAISKYFHYK